MEYTAEEERIFQLAKEIGEIRTRCFYVCGSSPCEHPQEVKKMRQEIEATGYLVRTECAVDTKTLEPRIDVKVFKPKENLPPDLAKIYDEWLMKRRLEFDENNKTPKEERPITDEEFLKKAAIKSI